MLAVGLGTSYAVRLAPADFEVALAAGAETTHVYRHSDHRMDLLAWGVGWLFGSYDASDAPRLEAARAHAAALAGRRWAP